MKILNVFLMTQRQATLKVISYDFQGRLSRMCGYVMLESFIVNLFALINVALPPSAPVDRLFSCADIVTRPHRRSMGDSVLD